MDTQFWLERWARHEIGFHQSAVNEYLVRFWPMLSLPDDAPTFVPLCGKTLDMRWLLERGHSVLGIEIARNACREFFEEWGVEPNVTSSGAFECWQARKITILCGDFFDLSRTDVANVAGVFDRAALIALPRATRTAYANKLREVLPSGARILLVAPDYDQEQMQGPPFAVSAQEIRELFSECGIEELASVDVTSAPANARFRQRGLTKLVERVFRIEIVE
jgi:thiopurine S-methyltransferase